MIRVFNKIQTELTDELLSKMTRDERNSLMEYIDSIEFIQNLASKERPYARDLKRWDNPLLEEKVDNPFEDERIRVEDPNGRIAVNLTNPHILEDMDYFRPAAIHFEKNGCYTKIFPNKKVTSENFFIHFFHNSIFTMVDSPDFVMYSWIGEVRHFEFQTKYGS